MYLSIRFRLLLALVCLGTSMAAEGGPTPAAGNPPLKAKDLESARLSREAAYIHALAFSLLTNRELLDPSGNHVSIDLLQTHLEEQQ